MSVTFRATLYDGRRSVAAPVEVVARAPATIEVHTDNRVTRYQLCDISVSPRLGDSARHLTLPGGEKLQTNDNDSVDRALDVLAARPPGRRLHALESSWVSVGIATLFTCAALWWSVFFGLPLLAQHTARALPISLENAMGQRSLSTLDTHMLTPTRLEELQRERVRQIFAMAAEQAVLDNPPKLELRRAQEFGPNAFALPSGIIVVTDELVMLAEQDGELLGVIAHELGHVHHRHVMRSVLQNSAVALLLATLLGDVSSVTGLAASVPTLLVEHGFSREFELEADRYASALMKKMGTDTSHLVSILRKLGTAHGVSESAMGDYLSTHPGVERRVDIIESHEATGEHAVLESGPRTNDE